MSNKALDLWREKLDFLQAEHAKASDPAQKFTLEQQIREAQVNVRELSGTSAAPVPASAPRSHRGGPGASTPVKTPVPKGRQKTSPTPWYKDYRFVVPIVVALIGLAGTLAGVWTTGTSGSDNQAATRSLVVVVTEEGTDTEISQAQVWIDEQGVSELTDSNGRCSLTIGGNLKRIRLHIKKAGYIPRSHDVDLVEGLRPLRFALKPVAAPPTTPAPIAVTAPTPYPATSSTSPALLSFRVVVFDDATGEGLPGARITLDEQGIARETDNSGGSTLTIAPGLSKVRVNVSHPEYVAWNQEIRVFEGMDPARIPLRRK